MVDALDAAMGSRRAAAAAPPPTEATRRRDAVPPPPPPVTPAQAADEPDRPGGRRPGAALLAGLATLLLLAVVGFLLLQGGGDGQEGEPAAQTTPTPTAEQTREPTATPTETPTQTPEPTKTATATPEPTKTAAPEPAREPDLGRARSLQLQGFNARQAGNYEQGLTLSQQALQACGDARELDPCGYALYEVGAALNALGRPDEAIPYLERRLDTYGNNGDVRSELNKAKQAAKRDGG
jgi:tetratricopeptide (TPR) repeat protein